MLSPTERHYSQPGIFEKILAALEKQGIRAITRKDIAAADEFHVRGVQVSRELANEAALSKNTRVLDIGCGIGGPCRMLAEEFGCSATGIDITAEYIRTAQLLSEQTGLAGLTRFMQADALQLPFPHESFDVVWTQHAQMNIADKERLYAEMQRVLVKRGRLVYYDILKKGSEPLHYPVPWANDASISFLIRSHSLHELLSASGFIRIQTKDQTMAGIDFLQRMVSNITNGPRPIGLHLLIGDSAGEKLANLLTNLKEERAELQSGIYRRADY